MDIFQIGCEIVVIKNSPHCVLYLRYQLVRMDFYFNKSLPGNN